MIRESFNLFYIYNIYELTLPPYCLSPQRLVDVVSSSERVAIFGNSVAPVIGFPVGKNESRPKILRGSIVQSGASCTVYRAVPGNNRVLRVLPVATSSTTVIVTP